MTAGSRGGLIGRFGQIRRPAAATEPPAGGASEPVPERLRALETRVAHLEQQVLGLQDSVHRESERHARLIGELQTQVQPATMRAALAEDARHRGL